MFLTPAKIRGGFGKILAVQCRVQPNVWCNFYDLFLLVSEIRGGEVYAKKRTEAKPKAARLPTYVGRPNKPLHELYQKLHLEIITRSNIYM